MSACRSTTLCPSSTRSRSWTYSARTTTTFGPTAACRTSPPLNSEREMTSPQTDPCSCLDLQSGPCSGPRAAREDRSPKLAKSLGCSWDLYVCPSRKQRDGRGGACIFREACRNQLSNHAVGSQRPTPELCRNDRVLTCWRRSHKSHCGLYSRSTG